MCEGGPGQGPVSAPSVASEGLCVCTCCGAPWSAECKCDVGYVEGNDPETGPWGEWHCFFHDCRAEKP
jgi:hypothetical protein